MIKQALEEIHALPILLAIEDINMTLTGIVSFSGGTLAYTPVIDIPESTDRFIRNWYETKSTLDITGNYRGHKFVFRNCRVVEYKEDSSHYIEFMLAYDTIKTP